MTLFRRFIACWIVLMVPAAGALAEPVLWPVEDGGNDHYYEVVLEQLLYGDAQEAAASSEFMGVTGHLVTIASAEENAFVASLAPVVQCPDWSALYLGGIRMDTSGAPDEGWEWITAEPWGYTNWSSNQPMGDGIFLVMWLSTCPDLREHGEWNDGNGLNGVGYVVEYEPGCDPGCAAELDQCLTDLDNCLASDPFLDEDGDGEADSTDACPATPESEEVDTAGCSHAQFCESQGPVATFIQILRCVRGDWKNDEAARWAPRDCRVNWLTRECTIR